MTKGSRQKYFTVWLTIGWQGREEVSPVLEIDFGPPAIETKNLKDYVNFDIGGLFKGPQLFGPPTIVFGGSSFQGLQSALSVLTISNCEKFDPFLALNLDSLI